MKLLFTLLSIGIALLGATVTGNAQIYTGGIVPDRSTLNSILAGYGPVTENFEAISLPPNVGQIGPAVLNSTTYFDGWVRVGRPRRDVLGRFGDLQWIVRILRSAFQGHCFQQQHNRD